MIEGAREGASERASERRKEGWTKGGGGRRGEGTEGRREGRTEGRRGGGAEGRRDEGTEGRRDEGTEAGTEGRRDGGAEGRRGGGTEGRRDGGREERKEMQRVSPSSLLLPSLLFSCPLFSFGSLAPLSAAWSKGPSASQHPLCAHPSPCVRQMPPQTRILRTYTCACIPPPIHPPTAPSLPAGRRGRRPRRPLPPRPPHRRTGQAQQGQARERTQLPRQLLSAGWAERGGGEGGHGRGFAQRHVHAHRGTIIGGLQRT